MKKALLLSLVLFAVASTAANAKWWNREDPCNPTPKCEPEAPKCYGCAVNKPEVLVKLTPCAYKDKPYNYYTWTKTAEKEVASGKYDWAAQIEE